MIDIRTLNFNEKKIVVIGTIFMDIKGYPEGLFIPAGRNAGRIEYKYGGVARNVAEDLTGLGCSPVFVSMCDKSGPGASIAAALKKAGVNVDYLAEVEDGIGTWMVILDSQGDVCANLSKRQNLMPLCSVLNEKGDEIFSDADGILLEMDIEEEVIDRVFSFAEKYNVDVYGVISNMTIALERREYIKKTRCFICNRQEAGQLFECDTLDMPYDELLEVMAIKMKEQGIGCMVVTMDKDGAVFADISQKGTDAEGFTPAVETAVTDSTGAGDSFFAGAAASMINGFSLQDACSIGAAMASEVIRSTENVYVR